MKNNSNPRLMTLFTVLIMFAASCQVEHTPQKVGSLGTITQQDQSSANPTQQTTYQIGDIISINNTLLIVLGWDQPPGGDFNPPGEGKKYLAVDILIANQGDRSFSISPIFQMSLKDARGQKYNLNGKANSAAGVNPPRGEVNPGELIRGKVGFQIPEDAADFTFVYEDKLVGLGEVNVKLGPQPISMEPPQNLNLAYTQEVYQIGDQIKISDLLITVLGISSPESNNLIKPREDYQFVIVDVSLTNQGTSTTEISSGLQMYLKDSTGQQYTLHLGAQSLAEGGLPDDELQPGETIRGQIGFEVPAVNDGLTFVFDAEVFGYGKVFVNLTN